MIFKGHIQYFFHISQGSVCSVERIVFANVILRSYPFSLEFPPKSFGQVEMWRIRRKKEDEKPSILPNPSITHHLFSPMNFGVIKQDNGLFLASKGQGVKIPDDFVGVDGFGCGKSIKIGVSVYNAKAIESVFLVGSNVIILFFKLPPIRHMATSTDVGFIPVIKVYAAFGILVLKFLQLLALVSVELRRGLSPWTFSYTFISCANADKKRLNISSDAFLPEDSSQAAFAAFTLCRSSSMVLRIVSSSAFLLIIGLAPCPGRFSGSPMPSPINLPMHLLMDCWHKSTFIAIFGELNPCSFKSTTSQRWRRKYATHVCIQAPRCVSVRQINASV
jgi:hypothetical protein